MTKAVECRFGVRVVDFAVLQAIEGFRTSDHYAALLDAMEFGDRSGSSTT